MTAPAENAHPIALAPADEPEAVVLDFKSPQRPGRYGVPKGRQAGFDKPGGPVSGSGGAPEHRALIALCGVTGESGGSPPPVCGERRSGSLQFAGEHLVITAIERALAAVQVSMLGTLPFRKAI